MAEWSSTSDNATWTDASTSTTGEMCPLCVLILEEPGGIALWEKYMHIRLTITPDWSEEGWYCGMCGASGEGRLPEFHTKPQEKI